MNLAKRDTQQWWVVASVLALTLGVLTAVSASAGPYDWAAGLPGCHPGQPAVAHYAGGVALVPQPTNGPVPCGVLTGAATVENRIEVTNDGTVIYMPALTPSAPPQVPPGTPRSTNTTCGSLPGIPGNCPSNTVARSSDGGATWSYSKANVFPDAISGDVDNNIYVDHDTGRFFYYDYDSSTDGFKPDFCGQGNGATIIHSDDSGATWSWGFDLEHNCSENPTILVGRPRISTPTGYPSVVYLCGNNFGTGIAGAGSTGKVCSKSLDGGLTWNGETFGAFGGGQGSYSGQRKDELHPYPQCANGASSSGGNDVQPLPDGTLLIVVSCGGNTYLSESRDEGASWQIRNRIPSGGTLRADSVGNLYKANGSLLSTSTDGGRTWSPERNMVAPGVTLSSPSFFVQGTHRVGHEVGRVAFTYYGHRTGQTTDDGFITETRNALDPNPVFWSGQVNSPTRPLLTNATGVNQGITIMDFKGGAFSPDGRSVWASFVQDCGTSLLLDPNCSSRSPAYNPGNPQDGFAGRLVWPH